MLTKTAFARILAAQDMTYDLEVTNNLQYVHVDFLSILAFPTYLYVQFVVTIGAFGLITQKDSTQFAIIGVYPYLTTFRTPKFILAFIRCMRKQMFFRPILGRVGDFTQLCTQLGNFLL